MVQLNEYINIAKAEQVSILLQKTSGWEREEEEEDRVIKSKR